jgi:hypothetical protein
MPITVKQAIEETVRERPGIGPGEIADLIGRDKSNTRAEALKLVRSGRLTARNNGNGYAFFPVGNHQEIVAVGHIDRRQEDIAHKPPEVIESVSFRDVTDSRLAPNPATGTAIVVHRPAGGARAITPRNANAASMAAHLNMLATIDPDGELIEAAQHRQHMAQIEAEHRERMRARELAAAAQRPKEPTIGELVQAPCFQATRALDAYQNMARANAEDRRSGLCVEPRWARRSRRRGDGGISYLPITAPVI